MTPTTTPTPAQADSIDTPEFRTLIAAVQGFDDGEPIFGESEKKLIEYINRHIEAQLRRATNIGRQEAMDEYRDILARRPAATAQAEELPQDERAVDDYHRHEVLDRTSILVAGLEDWIADHPAATGLQTEVVAARDALSALYQAAGNQHLARSAVPAQDGAPEGWTLVPTHPDQRMINAFINEYNRRGGSEEGCYRAFLAAAPAAPLPPAKAQGPEWRCFHCDESFTDADNARLHFGSSERQQPACQIDIAEYRAMEQRMIAYNDEDAEIHRSMYAMENQHQQELRREEEKGYARGLRDAGYVEPAAPANAPSSEVIAAVKKAIFAIPDAHLISRDILIHEVTAAINSAPSSEVQRDAVLRNLLDWAENQVCTHENTHRGGAIWEICDACGAQWADDRGGKPEFKWPHEILEARAAIAKAAGEKGPSQ